MGTTVSFHDISALLPNYFALVFIGKNRLRLLMAPESVIESTQELILNNNLKIDNVHKTGSFVEFKLIDKPWYSVGKKDVHVKYVLCELLKKYYLLGWFHVVSTNLDVNSKGRTCHMFEYRGYNMNANVICVSLNEADKLRVIGGSLSIIQLLKETIVATWPYGIQRNGSFANQMGWEFKLVGNPWWSDEYDEKEAIYTVKLINQLMNSLFKQGWSFVCSMRSKIDVDSLYFLQPVPSPPIDQDHWQSHFFAISLRQNDRLRFVQAKSDQQYSIKTFIMNHWSRGIKTFNRSLFEFKLNGDPWSNDEIDSKKLIGSLIEFLSNYEGYSLYATCELTRNVNVTTLLLRSKTLDEQPVPQGEVSSICFANTNRIRLINVNEQIVELVRDAISASWLEGIQEQVIDHEKNLIEIKLKGRPFSKHISSQVCCTIMMLRILSLFHSNGYRFVTCADLCKSKDNFYTWYFQRNVLFHSDF